MKLTNIASVPDLAAVGQATIRHSTSADNLRREVVGGYFTRDPNTCDDLCADYSYKLADIVTRVCVEATTGLIETHDHDVYRRPSRIYAPLAVKGIAGVMHREARVRLAMADAMYGARTSAPLQKGTDYDYYKGGPIETIHADATLSAAMINRVYSIAEDAVQAGINEAIGRGQTFEDASAHILHSMVPQQLILEQQNLQEVTGNRLEFEREHPFRARFQ